MLCVVENAAVTQSLNVIRSYTTEQGTGMCKFPSVFYYNYVSILCMIFYWSATVGIALFELLDVEEFTHIIGNGTVRQTECDFLLAFHSSTAVSLIMQDNGRKSRFVSLDILHHNPSCQRTATDSKRILRRDKVLTDRL